MIAAVSQVGAAALIADPGDQVEPDVYGDYVVYRDLRYTGSFGAAIVLYNRITGAAVTVNPSWNADNKPAVGENRVLWCDRRWDGNHGIVSSIIGSGVEDVILRDGGSAWGLDVSSRYAMWYQFDQDKVASLWVYSFGESRLNWLEATKGYYDTGAHMDHSSDRALIKVSEGSYMAVDFASGSLQTSSQAEYDSSRRGFYNGFEVWQEDTGYGYDIYGSHAPEPSTLTVYLCGIAAITLGRMGLRRKRA